MHNKIAIVGTFNTGKTTLFNALSKHPDFANYTFCSEPARAYLDKNNLDINEVNTNPWQLFTFQEHCFLEHIKRLTSQDIPWISDSSIYDNLAYAKCNLTPEQYQQVANQVTFAECMYDVIFYLPIEFDLSKADAADNRVADVEYQKAIDQNIKDLLTDNVPSAKIITLTGSVDERILQIKNVLKLCL
jgi:nicotinamide riboside kinase